MENYSFLQYRDEIKQELQKCANNGDVKRVISHYNVSLAFPGGVNGIDWDTLDPWSKNIGWIATSEFDITPPEQQRTPHILFTYKFDTTDKHILTNADYDTEGYDKDGFNGTGFNRDGYNKDGYDNKGFDQFNYNVSGYNTRGFNRAGKHKDTGKNYDSRGFDRYGRHMNGRTCDNNGYDMDGIKRLDMNSLNPIPVRIRNEYVGGD